MSSSKAYLSLLVRIFKEKGLETIIFSPGSRNAPLIMAFTAEPAIRCLKIPDERSAAYFALGMAQQTGKPTAIACTSGTAALNYAPAIAEAYYQKIPLLVLTADRTPKLIDQGDGQAIRQENLYANYIKHSYTFPSLVVSEKELQHIEHITNEAWNNSLYPEAGPVHINFPFPEPLYDFAYDTSRKVRLIQLKETTPIPDTDQTKVLAKQWNHSKRKMILTGLLPPNPNLEKQITELAQDPTVTVLTETTSNLYIPGAIPGIDKVVCTFSAKEAEIFKPDILLTMGGHIVSKMVKSFLRQHQPASHWHISPSGQHMDTFQCLTEVIPASPDAFLDGFLPLLQPGEGNYRSSWTERYNRSEERHHSFMKRVPFSDLKVFDMLFKTMPVGISVQLANSTPVRYSQLYRMKKWYVFYSNRGVSGIDGCISTAAGAAFATRHDTWLLTGDLAFFYDTNGLWHEYLDNHLKIVVINNGGGGIFRFIEGPDKTGHLDIFEAPHQLNARHAAGMFGIRYFEARDETSLTQAVNRLAYSRDTAILEVFTPREENGKILREYFNTLKNK